MITKESTNTSYMVLLKDNKGNLEKIAFPSPVQVGLTNIPKELILTGRLSVSIGDYKCRLNGSVTVDENHTIANISPLTSGSGFLYVKLPIVPRKGQVLRGMHQQRLIILKTKLFQKNMGTLASFGVETLGMSFQALEGPPNHQEILS
jgi:hypothetical protein